MIFTGAQQAIGLDVGTFSTKAVVLELRKTTVVTAGYHRLATAEEGILNERELYATISSWLRGIDRQRGRTVVGLPQYLSTTQVSDFPTVKGEALTDLVSYETQQLAGLSDETFIHDFHVMVPLFGRVNPVLIGICRESVIRERIETLGGAGIPLGDLAMNGTAIANALLFLYPDSTASEAPQAVLDLGLQSSTVVILTRGQPLFVGSLLFGAERLMQALLSKPGINEKNVADELRQLVISDESPKSPVIQAMRQLENELRNAIEHWRAQERAELADRPLERIWVSGGGAYIRGLCESLQECFEVPVHVFGPPDPETREAAPEFVTAFGLALQGLGRGLVRLSLLPSEQKQAMIRIRRFPFLVAACACLTVFLFSVLGRSYLRATGEQRYLRNQLTELEACEQLVPRLQSITAAVRAYENRMIPLVEMGNRPRRFAVALEALREACGNKDWFIYLADENSYQQGKNRVQKTTGIRRNGEKPGGMFQPVLAAGIGDTVIAPEFPVEMISADLPLLRSLIVAGYTELVPAQPYEAVREVVRKLNDSAAYQDVDLLPEQERIGREDIFEYWLEFFRQVPGHRFKAFTLRLPFAGLNIIPSAAKEEGTGE